MFGQGPLGHDPLGDGIGRMTPSHRPPAGMPYRSRPASLFRPERIILAKGAMESPARRELVESICAACPRATVHKQLDTPHNRIDLGACDPLAVLDRGKKTLVISVHHSAVRQSSEEGNTCPNYWHFSPYGFCPYRCHYCYLAGTQGVRFSPTVKIFVNLDEILAQVDRVAARLNRPTAFYLGKLQDGLALDPLTGYSRRIIPFFAAHPFARLTLLTKSADVVNLLDLEHRHHAILSWTLTPPAIAKRFEPGTPSSAARLSAMRACAVAGYPVRAVLMPLIPVEDWADQYRALIDDLLDTAQLDRITLGGICIYRSARQLMERRIGAANDITRNLATEPGRDGDGRERFTRRHRIEMYRFLIDLIRAHDPALQIGLCLEEQAVFDALGMHSAIGACNCVL
jgi:spore photoproduct lyase